MQNHATAEQPRINELRMVDIVKRFPGVLANDRVSFDVRAGEIHALLGENGAGKSTLMRQLYGLYRPDSGQILIDGQAHEFRSPSDSIRAGIGMVHQHFMLVPPLTVAENVALGLPSTREPRLDLDVVARRIDDLSQRYGLQMDPSAYVWQLSVGEQQRVEILKALYRGAALLVLDEPTAVLTPQEVDEWFVTVKQMAGAGHAIVFISHKLNEVLAFTDRVTVLRDGRNAGSVPTKEATKQSLANMMVGRAMNLQPERPPVTIGAPRLRLEAVNALSDRGRPALRDVSLEVRAGEILAVAGVSGNGQLELAEVIAGMRPTTGGRIVLDEKDITGQGPGQITEAGLGYIPEERNRMGLIKDFTISENLILRENHKPPFAQRGFLDFNAIARRSAELVRSFNIKTPSLQTPMKNLSGGNAQKLILARELSRRPGVLVAAQPTRGLDIGATEYVRGRIVQERAEGTATLLISEDLDEILALADRIAVLFQGQVMDILPRAEATPQQLGLLMAGVRGETAAA
jgi:simple sugar transport system ATP-binding protein